MTEHVSEAILKPTTISEQVLKDPAALTDEVLINDNGVLKKITLQIVQTLIRSGFSTIPIGAIVDFAGTEAPENWLMCFGQELSRETFSSLFGVIGVTYGAGNGTSSFLLPDLRGRVAAGKDDMGGTSAARFHPTWAAAPYNTGVIGTTLGSAGGDALHQLTTAELASHGHDHNHAIFMYPVSNENPAYGLTTGGAFSGRVFITAGSASTGTTTNANPVGSNQHHNNAQPTIILNKIIRYQ